MKFSKIISNLQLLALVSTSKNESWSNLTLSGTFDDRYSKTYFSQLYESLDEIGMSSAITLRIDNEPYSIEEFLDVISNEEVWNIHINKSVWLNKVDSHGIMHTFFLLKQEFLKWADDTDPFRSDNPFNENCIHIYVQDLNKSFGGPNFIVNDSDDISIWSSDIKIPSDLIESTIRIRCQEEFIISPQKHIVTFGEVTDYSKYFYRNSIHVLLCSLCDEVSSDKEIIIRGPRIIQTHVAGNNFSADELVDYQKTLISIVQWVFENSDNCSVKKNLFTDRVSLDLESGISLYDGLKRRITDIESQIKEQYRFILLDRKTEYQNELKELLKDIKGITDSLSDKVRSILSNLLRDVLAALVLVGITLFSQIDDIKNLSENNLINYVFDAFGIYFLVSIVLQVIFDVMDMNKSIKDLEYWKKITHNYISKAQFDTYKHETLGKRFKSMIAYYFIIVLFYLAISVCCFNYYSIWNGLLTPTSHNIEANPSKKLDHHIVITKDSLPFNKSNNDTIIRLKNK